MDASTSKAAAASETKASLPQGSGPVLPGLKAAHPADAARPDGGMDMQAQAISTTEGSAASAERFVVFGQKDTAALVESGRIWVAGLHDLSHEVTTMAQEAFTRNLGLLSSFLALRTHQDAVTLHATSVRAMVDTAAENAARLSGTSVRLAERAFAPIAARVDAAAAMASATKG